MDRTLYRPEDWVNGVKRIVSIDTGVGGYIRYKGSAATATIDIANTTGDITLKEATVADVTVNPAGTTPGTIDLSAEATTWGAVADLVNASPNWEMYLTGARRALTVCNAGAGHIVFAITAGDCKTATGYPVLVLASVVLSCPLGITFNGPSTGVHNHDANCLHRILQITGTFTYSGSGTQTIKVYACDDAAKTETLLDTILSATSTSANTIPGTVLGAPIYSQKGVRIVVESVAASGTFTAAVMTVTHESLKYGPGIRKANLISNTQ